jgi:hypothetical protein
VANHCFRTLKSSKDFTYKDIRVAYLSSQTLVQQTPGTFLTTSSFLVSSQPLKNNTILTFKKVCLKHNPNLSHLSPLYFIVCLHNS